jgi:hypothetical protein
MRTRDQGPFQGNWNIGRVHPTAHEPANGDHILGDGMTAEMRQKILQAIEDEVNSRPSSIEFEMAYQARVAIDRIRFAIRQTEEFAPRTDEMREVGIQLLGALDRLQNAERRFQQRFRTTATNGKPRQIESVECDMKTCPNGGRS